MIRPPGHRGPVPGERFYKALLQLHPRRFRDRHDRELIEHFREAWAEVEGADPWSRVSFWWRIASGVVGTAVVQRFEGGEDRAAAFPGGEARRGREGERRSGNHTGEGGMGVELWIQEVRVALRSLRRRPVVSLVVVATLGLGLGANTAVFSVLQSVLLAPLPYEDADRLVRIYANRRDRPGESERMFLTNPATTELRDGVRSLQAVAVLDNYAPEWADVTGETAPERVRVLRVGAGYFGVLREAPLAGASFGRSEEHGQSRVVVVREAIADRLLGGATAAVGRSLVLDGEPHTVVGVVDDAFDDPLEGRVDVWAPADLTGADAENWDNSFLSAFGRLAPGSDLVSLRAELDLVAARHDAIDEDAAEKGFVAVPLRDDVVGSAGPLLRAVMGAVVFLLLLTCVNVASILVAGGAAKQREMAIRTSVGSPRSGLVRIFVFEAALLAAAGSVAGFLLGSLALEALVAVAPPQLPRLDEVGWGPDAVAFGTAAAVLVALVLGLATAIPFTRPRVGVLLGGHPGGGEVPRARRVRGALVTVEVALAVVLLVGAGVLLRTVDALRTRDLGAEPAGVLTWQVGLPGARYGAEGAELAFHQALQQRLAALPGVVSVAATTRLPVTGTYNTWGTRPAIAEGEPVDMDNVQVNQRWVLGDFFRTAGLSPLAGRLFQPSDDTGSPRVVVVNRAFARLLFPGEDPVGRMVRVAGWYPRIVGVVEDEALTARAEPEPMAYHSLGQWPVNGRLLAWMARTEGDPVRLVPAVRAELATLDPDLVLFQPRPLAQVVGVGTGPERFAATLLSAFATLAILIAGLGLYGILSQLVSRQRREIGVRLALGADVRGVRGMVVARGLRLATAGTLLGTLLAAGLVRLLDFLVFGGGTHDPLVFGVVPFMLLAIALASSWLPATRATRVDPVECLRGD